MPRRVAPQWLTLRGVHSICRPSPCYTLRCAGPLVFAAKRGYAKTAIPDSKSSPSIRTLNSAILIPSSVKDVQPDTLVNHITPVARGDVARNTFCVFLVTPSFAPWLLNDDTFLTKAIRRAYSKASTNLPIQVLCAVVDKLPTGRALACGTPLQDIVTRRSSEPPVGESGFEGIAYATLPRSASVPSTSPRSPDKGAIDFILSGHTMAKRPYTDTWRLPLANTVFQTGSPTTMYCTNWTLNAKDKALVLQEKSNVTHHGVGMAASGTVSGRISSVLSIPLLPLTPPRPVEGCMGNIIRRVMNAQGESVTASSELEKVVPQFFKARGEPAQATTAWALIIPKKKMGTMHARTMRLLSRHMHLKEKGTKMGEILWERLWQTSPTHWNTLVSTALAEGARLHRVLSGGGGWGKKAGLLSLDPVPVSEEVPIRMEDATSGFDGPGDFSSALTPVVHDGDAIQFFISPAPSNQVEGDKALELLKALPKERTLGWELGTIPSTVDSIPGGSWQHVGADSKYVAVFRNSFGALSEGGLTLTRGRAAKRKEPMLTFATTTIDVPYSRLWSVELTEQADKESSANDLKFSWQRESQELLHRLAKRDPVLPASIRKIVVRNALDSSFASDRYHFVSTAITDLTEQHRSCMQIIRTRLRRFEKHSNALPDLITNMSIDVEKSSSSLDSLHHQVYKITRMAVRKRLSTAPGIGSQVSIRRYTAQETEVPIRRFVSRPGERRNSEIEELDARTTRVKSMVVGLRRSTRHMGVQDRNISKKATQQHVGKLRIRRHLAGTTLRIRQHMVQGSKLRNRRQQLRASRETTTTKQPQGGGEIPLRDHVGSPMSSRRIRYTTPLSIQKYESSRLVKERRSSRPPRPSEPRRHNKKQLLQAVSSWLSDTPTTSKGVKAARRAGRPFGSRAFGSGYDEGGEAEVDDMDREERRGGLDLLMDTVKQQEGSKGRRRR